MENSRLIEDGMEGAGGSGAGRRREAPAWLERFANQDYSLCLCTADHGCQLNRGSSSCSCNVNKFFCINCQSEPLCRFTILQQHQGHRVLHVIRIAGHGDPAILAKEICELVDVDGIQRYIFDRKPIVYLNRCPLNSPSKMKRRSCTVCGRSLVSNNRVGEQELASLKFCSISCKMKGSAEPVEAAAGEAGLGKAMVAAMIAGLKSGESSVIDRLYPAANPVSSRNAPRALPGSVVLPDQGAHERDEGETERIPPDEESELLRLFSFKMEGEAEAAFLKAALEEACKAVEEFISLDQGQAQVEKRKKIRLFGKDIWC